MYYQADGDDPWQPLQPPCSSRHHSHRLRFIRTCCILFLLGILYLVAEGKTASFLSLLPSSHRQLLSPHGHQSLWPTSTRTRHQARAEPTGYPAAEPAPPLYNDVGGAPTPSFDPDPPTAWPGQSATLWDLEAGGPYSGDNQQYAPQQGGSYPAANRYSGNRWDLGEWDQGWWNERPWGSSAANPAAPNAQQQWFGQPAGNRYPQQSGQQSWSANAWDPYWDQQQAWPNNGPHAQGNTGQSWDSQRQGSSSQANPSSTAQSWGGTWDSGAGVGNMPTWGAQSWDGWVTEDQQWGASTANAPKYSSSSARWGQTGWQPRSQRSATKTWDSGPVQRDNWEASRSAESWGSGRRRPRKRSRRSQFRNERFDVVDESEDPSPSVPVPPAAISSEAISAVHLRKHLTGTSFESLALSPPFQRVLRFDLNITHTTKVQEMFIPLALQGKDIILQAKMGTGKTLAFLLPIFEQLYHATRPRNKISAILLTPSKETATALMSQCSLLTKFTDIAVEMVTGGTGINRDIPKFQHDIDFLIATPGRLLEHLRSNAEVVGKLEGAKFFAVDDADQMANQRYWPDIQKIQEFLPPVAKRQTLAITSTLPASLLDTVRLITNPGEAEVIRTSDDSEAESMTADVPNTAIVVPYMEQWPLLMALLRQEIQKPPFKVAVFFPTARIAQIMVELFAQMGIQVLEYHIRKSAAHREKALEQFRKGQNVILFSADVPPAKDLRLFGVTCCIQIGMCLSPQQYAQRMGVDAVSMARPPRSVLVLSDVERPFLEMVASRYSVMEMGVPQITKGDRAILERGIQKMLQRRTEYSAREIATQVYVSWLGFYLTERPTTKLSKAETVVMANKFITWLFGGHDPPAIMPSTTIRMGLEGVEGIVVDDKKFDI